MAAVVGAAAGSGAERLNVVEVDFPWLVKGGSVVNGHARDDLALGPLTMNECRCCAFGSYRCPVG